MTDLLRRYFLSTVFAPDDGTGTPQDDPVADEIDLEDDEGTSDPAGEEEGADDATDDASDESVGDVDAAADTPPPASRGDRSIGALRQRARDAAEQNARLTRELDELRRQVGRPPAAPVETPQQRADRLALLSPEDRVLTIFREEQQAFAYQQQQFNAQLADNSDRVAFEARAASSPMARKFQPAVERELAAIRRSGAPVPRRDLILEVLVGRAALANSGRANPRAAANRQRQAARPPAAQGDVRATRQRQAGSASDFETRFGDVPI